MTKSRVQSVDALRGLVMIIMALDHTRDFFHAGAQSFQPEDLSRTTAILFFTRWITHICAPVFMFAGGVGAWFWLSRGRTTNELSRFLWTRGLWLVLLELTVLRVALNFSWQGIPLLTVLWALGWSMIALGFLAHLPVRVLSVLSLLGIALHNLADPIRASQIGAPASLWNVLHQPGAFAIGPVTVRVAYPLVPWIFVMAAGFCFGRVFTLDPESRRRRLIQIGAGLTLAFVAIRALNIYGDPSPWTTKFPGMTLLSFLRCIKYPPSLDFLLMTLGPAILILAWFDRLQFSRTNPLIVFGRVPLFYFLVHMFVIHALAVLIALLRYGHAEFLFRPLPYPPGFGYSLAVVYAVWGLVVILLYPASLWFARLKERRSDPWLSYL